MLGRRQFLLAVCALPVIATCSPDQSLTDPDTLRAKAKGKCQKCQPPPPMAACAIWWEYQGTPEEYRIYTRMDGQSYPTTPALRTTATSATCVDLAIPLDGLRHYFVATAVVNGVESPRSNEVSKVMDA